MPEYGFVVSLPDGDDQEYRTSGPSLGPNEAVERAYLKYPDGRITQVLYGSVEGVDLSPEDDETEDDAEDDESVTGVTAPFDPADYSVSDLEDELDALSAGELRALYTDEQDGKNRTTALDAIDEAHGDADE